MSCTAYGPESGGVYESHEGRPVWASHGLRVFGYMWTALTAGVVIGRFVQIAQYMSQGVIPVTLAAYTGEATIGTLAGPMLGGLLIFSSYRYPRRIDEAFQPWVEFVVATNDRPMDPGVRDADTLQLNLMLLKATTPLIAVGVPLAVATHTQAGLEPVLEALFWPAVAVSGWMLYRQCDHNDPDSEYLA